MKKKKRLGKYTLFLSTQKKVAKKESCESSFIWEQNKDYSPGDTISDSSEKLLQRVRGNGQYIYNFVEGGVHANKYIFLAEGFS